MVLPAAPGAAGASDAPADEGFLNLASLQPGTRAARDQSSYSEWLEVHQRRREQAAEVAECMQVSDVASFPREPPPQKVVVSDTRLGGLDKELFSSRTKRGEFVFDRAFQPATQEELFATVGAPLAQASAQLLLEDSSTRAPMLH